MTQTFLNEILANPSSHRSIQFRLISENIFIFSENLRMNFPLVRFMLIIGSMKTSSMASIKQLNTKPHCTAVDLDCMDDRPQRDSFPTVVDYDDEHIVCDDDHPLFCDIVGPLYGIKDKLKKSSNVEKFDAKVMPMPFEVLKQKKNNYESSQGNESMQKSNIPNSDGFICAEYGFFPGT